MDNEVKYTARDIGNGIVINETNCSRDKNIDEYLQHLRECDKCYFGFKDKFIKFLTDKKNQFLIMTLKSILKGMRL